MASNSGWTTGLPSGTSKVSDIDSEFQSLKSFVEAWGEQEHYITSGSATSAGIAKHGAGRAFVGPASQLSNPTADNDGRLFWVTDTRELRIAQASSSSWSVASDNVMLSSAQTWTALQEFNSGISFGAPVTITPNTGSAISGIVSGVTNLATVVSLTAGNESDINMVNSSSILTHGDPITVGFTDDNTGVGARVLATAQVRSNGSIGIQFHNPTGVTRTIPSGTTIRYVAFAFGGGI